MFSLVKRFFQSVIPGVIRPLHILWNEIIGFIFISLGVVGLSRTYSFYRDSAHSEEEGMKMLFSGSFAVIMLYFGISSFWRARKIGKTS